MSRRLSIALLVVGGVCNAASLVPVLAPFAPALLSLGFTLTALGKAQDLLPTSKPPAAPGRAPVGPDDPTPRPGH